MVSVFAGGLAIQEYVVGGRDGSPQPSALRTEFIRGEGMGGGVGGMVYSLKHQESSIEDPTIICSHANHRGDVIARSDKDGSLTYFALYEAYGTRPYEWGSDPDRFKNNTKEEEADLDLTNDGMRYRDRIGYLTRDPIGYADGPNVYCYVHCNPITHFDALGLGDRSIVEWHHKKVQELRDFFEKAGHTIDEAADGLLVYAKDHRQFSHDVSKKWRAVKAALAKRGIDLGSKEAYVIIDGEEKRITQELMEKYPAIQATMGHKTWKNMKKTPTSTKNAYASQLDDVAKKNALKKTELGSSAKVVGKNASKALVVGLVVWGVSDGVAEASETLDEGGSIPQAVQNGVEAGVVGFTSDDYRAGLESLKAWGKKQFDNMRESMKQAQDAAQESDSKKDESE